MPTGSSRPFATPPTPAPSATARFSSSTSSPPCASAPAYRPTTLCEGVQLMLSRFSKLSVAAGLVGLAMAAPALAQEAAAAAAPAAPFTPTPDMVNKGDTAWMLVSAALVLMMSVPALALFYGGL